jgi:hypothetical protein
LQEQFRLDEPANEEHAKRVFHNAARKVINGSMSDARVKAVTVYFKKVKGQRMTNKQACEIHLTAEEYKLSEVDWLTAHPEAWVKLCEYWASDEYKVISDRNRLNQKSKPGLHRFGADGFIGKSQRMV